MSLSRRSWLGPFAQRCRKYSPAPGTLSSCRAALTKALSLIRRPFASSYSQSAYRIQHSSSSASEEVGVVMYLFIFN